MKKILLLTTVCALFCTHRASAQWTVIDPSNLIQNITTVSKTGTTATNVINSFKEMKKIYDQGKEYYDRLQTVHSLIRDARKVKETVELVSEIAHIYSNSFNRMLSDTNFTPAELEAISGGYTILLRESGNLLADIKEVISSNGLSMTDAERMAIIDRIHRDMLSHRNLVRYYSNKSISISYIRSREKNDMERVRVLYGDPSQRYW